MLIHVNPEKPALLSLTAVSDSLKEGELVIFPTDTVYAIGCDLYSNKGFEELCRIKGVDTEKANFSFICHDLSQMADFTKPISNQIFRVMKRALPGPFTFILEANANVPKIFRNKKKTIGIRVPDNNIATALVKELGNPIISTSVYDPDELLEYSSDPEMIQEKYVNAAAYVVAGGPGNLLPSTIIDCTSGEPVVIRQGLGYIEEYI